MQSTKASATAKNDFESAIEQAVDSLVASRFVHNSCSSLSSRNSAHAIGKEKKKALKSSVVASSVATISNNSNKNLKCGEKPPASCGISDTNIKQTSDPSQAASINSNNGHSASTCNASANAVAQPKTVPPNLKKSKKNSKPSLTLEEISAQTYWDSTEAKVLFNTPEGEANAKVTVKRRLSIIRKALATPNGYQGVIDIEPQYMHLLTESEIGSCKNKLMYLYMALKLALKHLDGPKNFQQCCSETVEYMKNHFEMVGGAFGFVPLKHPGTLQKVHKEFKQNEKIHISSENNFNKRVKKYLEKKRKLEDNHQQWLSKGWARNRKLKLLEEKMETIKKQQGQMEDEEDDDEDDVEEEDYQKGQLSREEYEMLMRY